MPKAETIKPPAPRMRYMLLLLFCSVAVGESAGAADFKRELVFLLPEYVYCVLLIFFPAGTWPGSFAGFVSFTSVVTACWAGACFSSVVVFASMLIWKIKDLGEDVRFLFMFFNRFFVRVFMKINVLCCNKSGIGNCMQVAAVQCHISSHRWQFRVNYEILLLLRSAK